MSVFFTEEALDKKFELFGLDMIVRAHQFVEAGYKLGLLLARRDKPDAAARVWWTDVITKFLINEKAPVEADAKRPYWLARTLYDLGELQEKRGRLEEAKAAYLVLLEQRLPFGDALARVRLQQLGVPVATAAP